MIPVVSSSCWRVSKSECSCSEVKSSFSRFGRVVPALERAVVISSSVSVCSGDVCDACDACDVKKASFEYTYGRSDEGSRSLSRYDSCFFTCLFRS